MKQMIMGNDVILWNNGISETIHNVLIGEPNSQDMTEFADENGLITYILAIPKGDNHVWTDKKISFFGENFRTIGYPMQGIEENMPLAWHKKVKVQRLVTNADITLFEGNTFAKHIFKDVHYSDQRSHKFAKDGMKSDGAASIHVFAVNSPDASYAPKIGDIVVKGVSDFKFDDTSEKSVSESMAEFRRLYPDYGTINSVEIKVYGTLPDYIFTMR